MQHNLQLEMIQPQDLPTLIDWVPDARFLLQWAGTAFTHPLTLAQLQRHQLTAHVDPPRLIPAKVVQAADGAMVGYGELAAIDHDQRSAWLARMLVAPTQRGQGIGSYLVHALLHLAFNHFKLHRVSLNVFDFNQTAVSVYQKAGFQIEGHLREARRFGDQFWSFYLMSILEQEWAEKNS